MKNFSQNTIYALKRAYGTSARLYRILDKSLNLEIGQQTITTQVVQIRKVIFLPTNVERRVFSKYTYYFDPDKRLVVIDRRDINFEIRVGDYLIRNCQKYNIVEVNDYELETGYLLVVQADDRSKWLLADDTLEFTQTVAETIV